MKKKHLVILAGTLFLVGLAYFSFLSEDKEPNYVPRNMKAFTEKGYKGAIEWMESRRVDGEGKIDPVKVRQARLDAFAISKLKSTKSTFVGWDEMGPDNVGGRTRAILYDKDNYNIIYAGAVSGGLWRSTTGGQSWSRTDLTIVDENDIPISNLNVSCITQTANGDIYFGTGELTTANPTLSSLTGSGIWKSTDGITFKRLSSTWGTAETESIFVFVSSLGSDPSNPERIYAATARGLRISPDGGATWEGVSMTLNTKVCRDLKVASDGTILSSIGNKTYLSYNNGESFESPLGSPVVGTGRLEFGISPSDPNYMYCQAVLSSELDGVYRSVDKGQTWEVIGPGGTIDFQPTGTQGMYDNAIAVFPNDPEKVITGGQANMWSFSPGQSWEVVSDGYVDRFPSLAHLYVHADQHTIVFHPEYNGTTNRTFLVGTDGGVFISEYGGLSFSERNKNYTTAQFYTIASDGYGHLVGGTQDNGTLINLFNANTTKNFFEIKGGDGGYCAMSNLDPRVTFATVYYGNLQRSQEKGRGFDTVGNYFYNNYILNRYFGGLESNIGSGGAAGFVTLFKFWEHKDDQNSIDSVTYTNLPIQLPIELYPHFEDSIRSNFTNAYIDTFTYINSFGFTFVNVEVIIGAGEKLTAKSQIHELPIEFELPYTLYPDDEIRIKDPYQAMLAIPLRRSETGKWNIMLTRKPLHFNISKVDQPWCRLLPDNIEDQLMEGGNYGIRDLEFSADGNYIFFAFYNSLYRISGLLSARTRAELTADSADYSLDVKKIKDFGSSINGIAVDPNNPDKVLVTLAGFLTTDNVLYSNNATSSNPSFLGKQGINLTKLPSMPVFDGIINCMDGKQVLLGTEYGVFTTDDITANNPQWTDQNTGSLGPVVTPALWQQTWPNQDKPHVENHGVVYIGTHGRGMFKSDVWKGPVAIQEPGSFVSNKQTTFTIFPNPVVNNAHIEFNLNSTEEVELKVFDLQGKAVREIKMGKFAPGNHTLDVDFATLNPGTYIVNMLHGNTSKSTKVVVF